MNGQADASVCSAVEFWSKLVQSRVSHTQNIYNPDRPDAAAQARQTIDDELAAMHQAMYALRKHRNTLAPISRIPLEILARILEFHAIDQPPSRKRRPASKDMCGDLGWIRVTHVCKSWRDAALYHLKLWCNVTNELGLSWLELMLDRAKSLPLSYRHLDCGRDSKRSLARILPGLLFRIRSLSISDKIDAIDVALQLLNSPARMLHTLELNGRRGCDHHITLPQEILENDTPMLCRLHLHEINVSWSASIFRGLKHLRVDHDKYCKNALDQENAIISSYRNFFCALGRMPGLETLYLAHILPSSPKDHSMADCTAQLLCLQSLTLIDDGDKCLDILQRLDIPPSCRHHFGCRYSVVIGPEGDAGPSYSFSLPEFLAPLCGHFSANADPFHTVSVFHNPDGAGLKLWRTSNVSDSNIFHPPHEPDLLISLRLPFEHERFPEPKVAMCDMLPLENIRVFIVRDCWFQFYPYQWRHLFATKIQRVGSVFVDKESDASNLCKVMLFNSKAVQDGDGQDTASTQDQIFLPNLELLEVGSTDFRPHTDLRNQVVEMAQLYVNMFTQRHMRSKAISTFRLDKNCKIDTAGLDALKAVVHVEWDPDTD